MSGRMPGAAEFSRSMRTMSGSDLIWPPERPRAAVPGSEWSQAWSNLCLDFHGDPAPAGCGPVHVESQYRGRELRGVPGDEGLSHRLRNPEGWARKVLERTSTNLILTALGTAPLEATPGMSEAWCRVTTWLEP